MAEPTMYEELKEEESKENTAIKGKIRSLKDNSEALAQMVSECNSWDGSLESYEVHSFEDEFFETYFGDKPMEAVRAVHFGDIQSWSDEYIRFNGYGNLESLTEYTYQKELEDGADEIVDRFLELYDENHVDAEWIINNYCGDNLEQD